MKLQHANGNLADIDIVVHEDWAPLGAKRFLELVKAGYFNNCKLYRVIPDFIVQWGIPADPAEWKKWGEQKIADDPVKVSNTIGTLSFAMSGPSAPPPQRDPRLFASACACTRRARACARALPPRAAHVLSNVAAATAS